MLTSSLQIYTRSRTRRGAAQPHAAQQNPQGLCKTFLCGARGYPLCLPGLHAGRIGAHLCTLRGAMSSYIPQAGATGLPKESWGLASMTAGQRECEVRGLLPPSLSYSHLSRGISSQSSSAPSHLHSLILGFALRGTAFDFLTSTWTREGPTALLEKSECLASGSPR